MPQYSATVAVSDPDVEAFLQTWANALEVSVSELLDRVLAAAVEGELYVEKLPV